MRALRRSGPERLHPTEDLLSPLHGRSVYSCTVDSDDEHRPVVLAAVVPAGWRSRVELGREQRADVAGVHRNGLLVAVGPRDRRIAGGSGFGRPSSDEGATMTTLA